MSTGARVLNFVDRRCDFEKWCVSLAPVVENASPPESWHMGGQWLRISRHMPQYLFSFVWTLIFKELQVLGLSATCRSLQKQYFEMRTTTATTVLWDAHWRAGPDRIMPGTACGSAPQEAWHRHVHRFSIEFLRFSIHFPYNKKRKKLLKKSSNYFHSFPNIFIHFNTFPYIS